MDKFQIFSLILSALSLLGVGTAMSLFWNDRHEKRKQNTEEKKKEAEERNKRIVREAVAEEIKPVANDVQEIKVQIDKLEDGTLSTLRNAILTCYYKCNEKGYRNDYDYENVHHLWDAYDELHGNSFVEDVMKRFDELPTKEEFRRKHDERDD